jgi:subtilisin-like proprotein convertase family protein
MRRLTLTLTLAIAACLLLAAAGTASAATLTYGNNVNLGIADNTVTSTTITLAYPGKITHLGVSINGLDSDAPNSLEAELISPSGTSLMLFSDSCGSATIANYVFDFDDSELFPMNNDVLSCDDANHPPSNFNDGGSDFSMPPSISTLAGFNGESPTGRWQLRFNEEDAAIDHSHLDSWTLKITTDGDAATQIPN